MNVNLCWSYLYIRIPRRTLLMALSLLLQQCHAYLVHLTCSDLICSKQHAASLCCSYLAFSQGALLKSKWYSHTLVLIQFQLGHSLSLLLFTPLRVFYSSVSRWSFTGVWVTASLKSPGLFSVFCLILIML